MQGLFGHLETARSTPGVPAAPPAGAEWYARVAVERGIDRRTRTRGAGGNAGAPGGAAFPDPGSGLTYASIEPLCVGERVVVPLGKGNKQAAGVVVEAGGPELAAGLDGRRVKLITSRTGHALPPQLVELAQWMSAYYVCPLGMVMSTMMPAAVKKGTGWRSAPGLRLAPGAMDAALDSLTLPASARAAWEAILSGDALPLLAADGPGLSRTDLTRRLSLKSATPLNHLVKAGLLLAVKTRVLIARGSPATDDTPPSAPHQPADLAHILTPEQARATDGIISSLGAFGVHLLHGVTGSGKTEVYLRVIHEALRREPAASAIVLVPEIALTPQTVARFTSRFRSLGVAVLHSGLSASQRAAQWSLASGGGARVIVGARSAVFAPVPGPRVIIVDEEHDTSYKQDQLPRYHARDVAIKRAQLQGATVVLGSATPSLESWLHAEPTGKYRLWQLPRRAAGASLPDVQIVDLAREWTAPRQELPPPSSPAPRSSSTWRGPHSVGPTLEHAVRTTLAGDGQVMLLLNRRGFASVLVCPSPHCGWRLQCDSCDATLVLHKRLASSPPGPDAPGEPSPAGPGFTGYVRCHHCLAENRTPRVCPACGRPVLYLGAGTQRVEDEIRAKFASCLGGDASAILRLDSDTMTSARDYAEALGRFAAGRARLLLGTQMIAKGLDFPNVQLVGVLSADTALWLPDFRAAERTFQLVSQVAGRAGRGSRPGRVIVQTYSPDSSAIIHASRHDFEAFAREELVTRRLAGLPPIGRLARIVVRDEHPDRAHDAAAHLAGQLTRALGRSGAAGEVRVDGPAPCAVSRIAGHHRFEILLLARTRAAIQSLLADVRSRGELCSDEHTAIDIDPLSLL